MNRAEARTELWRRYDAGEMPAAEVEARLRWLDDAGDDDASVRRALERALPLHRRSRGSRIGLVVGAALVVLVLGTGVVATARGGDGGSPTATSTFQGSGVIVGGPAIDVAVPQPAPLPDCPPIEPPPGDPAAEAAANPALLSDPPFLPEGYEVDIDGTIVPGTDSDIAMSTAAGSPPPVEIHERQLDGDLLVRMRAFVHEDPETATAASENLNAQSCSFGGEPFRDEANPEIGGSVVSGVIPTTAFAGWQLGERRILVSVESEGDGEGAIGDARALAVQIALAELEAARTPAPVAEG